jgi:hypothetical protein
MEISGEKICSASPDFHHRLEKDLIFPAFRLDFPPPEASNLKSEFKLTSISRPHFHLDLGFI